MEDRFDVVIIGCGFSGLLCSYYLRDAGINNVCVFEMNSSLEVSGVMKGLAHIREPRVMFHLTLICRFWTEPVSSLQKNMSIKAKLLITLRCLQIIAGSERAFAFPEG